LMLEDTLCHDSMSKSLFTIFERGEGEEGDQNRYMQVKSSRISKEDGEEKAISE
jgi:hypothetical protein